MMASMVCKPLAVRPAHGRPTWHAHPRSHRNMKQVASASPPGDLVTADRRLAELQACDVLSLSGEPKSFSSVWTPVPEKMTLLIFFTHWADLGSWELAQRVVKKWPYLMAAEVDVVAVGLGSVSGGAEFARLTGFPSDNLYADPSSACCKALEYSPGFLPSSDLNGYAKIFPMLAGIGSPGTMQEVIRGYIGDREADPVYEKNQLSAAFDVLGKGYQRPFELATLRLTNMVGSLSNWSKLAPEDTQQLVQQGGSLLMKGAEIIYEHKDTGILITTNMDDVLAAVEKQT